MSFKTQGSDLEDRMSLDTVSDYGSWWNFHRRFRWIVPLLWHHLQVHLECPCPSRLREETWRTGGVLTSFLMSVLDETFTDTSEVCSLPSDTISKCFRNIHVLQDSRKRLGGQEESWKAFSQPIIIKFAGNIPWDVTTLLTPSPSVSGTSLSSKTPGGDLYKSEII